MLVARLILISGDPEGPLFISKRKGPVAPLGTKGIRGIVRIAASRAKIEKPCRPHSFRHARATFLKRRGTPDDSLRQWFGWTKLSPRPLQYVSRKAEEQIAEIADKLGYEPLPPPGPVEELLPEDLIPKDMPLLHADLDKMTVTYEGETVTLEKFAAVLGESLKEMVQEEVQKHVKST